jgi:hypothetical protein
MNLRGFTKIQYQKFSEADGSQYIASEYALYRILKLVQKYKPHYILEAGVGIGTISDSILKSNFSFLHKIYGTENNEFCLSQLPENLRADYNNLNLFSDIKALPSNLKFDFIIIDGKEDALASLKDMMSERCIIVVEGDRKDQTEVFNRMFSNSKFVHSITSKKNNSYSNRSKNHFQGGLKIIFVKPDRNQFLEWIKLKISSKFHFQFRKLVG